MDFRPAGHLIYYIILITSTILILFLGVALISSGIYIWAEVGYFNTLVFFLLLVGLMAIGFSLYAIAYSKYSQKSLSVYFFMNLFMLVSLLTFGLVLAYNKERIVDWLVRHMNEPNKDIVDVTRRRLFNNMDANKITMLSFLPIFLIDLVAIYLYRGTLLKNISDASNTLLM